MEYDGQKIWTRFQLIKIESTIGWNHCKHLPKPLQKDECYRYLLFFVLNGEFPIRTTIQILTNSFHVVW